MKSFQRDMHAAEPLGTVSNGVIGINVGASPLDPMWARASGLFERTKKGQGCIALLPNPLGLKITANGEAVTASSQSLNLSTGTLESRLEGQGLRVESRIFCSRSHPHVMLHRLEFQAERDVELRLRAAIDVEVAQGKALFQGLNAHVDAYLLWETGGGESQAGIALSTQWLGPDASCSRDSALGLSYRVELKAGQSASFEQWGSLLGLHQHSEPHHQALRLLRSARWRGADDLEQANEQAWQKLWQGRLRLHGAGSVWQDLADAASYHLHAAAHPSATGSIPPFGLSSSGYHGQVFWDTDSFMFPHLLLVQPEAARALLEYRLTRMPAARNLAKMNGYPGIMFPWESGEHGDEVTPIGVSCSEEHHVTLDVAYAAIQYARFGEDQGFAQRELWPLLDGVCRWIEGRVTHTERGAEIHHVIGIDEGLINVNNNSFTNLAARQVLLHTSKLAAEWGLSAAGGRWRKLAKQIYLPRDPELGILSKHEGYQYEGGPCVPETLAAFFPFDYEHPDVAEMERSFDWHLDLAETVMHFPMLSSLFGVWACRRGRRDLALRCFEKGILDFVCPPFHSFSEWSRSPKPNFLTNPAGFLTACSHGLMGMVPSAEAPERWGRHAICLPKGWEAVELEQAWIQGRPARLIAEQGAPGMRCEWLD